MYTDCPFMKSKEELAFWLGFTHINPSFDHVCVISLIYFIIPVICTIDNNDSILYNAMFVVCAHRKLKRIWGGIGKRILINHKRIAVFASMCLRVCIKHCTKWVDYFNICSTRNKLTCYY